MRRAVRELVPPPLRARLRELAGDLPHRLRDAPADLAQLGAARERRLPPPSLRLKVAANSSRREFLAIGRSCAADLLAAYRRHAQAPADWLDFGCGCGRVARHLLASPELRSYTGVDSDPALIAWAGENLAGRWLATSTEPPLPLPERAFDVVVSVSVFTHLTEADQLRWLEELRRVMRPGGLLLASTHPASHASHLPPRYALPEAEVEARGFAHVASIGPFNHQASFHSAAYLQATWSRWFALKEHVPHGLAGYQDLSVWAA